MIRINECSYRGTVVTVLLICLAALLFCVNLPAYASETNNSNGIASLSSLQLENDVSENSAQSVESKSPTDTALETAPGPGSPSTSEGESGSSNTEDPTVCVPSKEDSTDAPSTGSNSSIKDEFEAIDSSDNQSKTPIANKTETVSASQDTQSLQSSMKTEQKDNASTPVKSKDPQVASSSSKAQAVQVASVESTPQASSPTALWYAGDGYVYNVVNGNKGSIFVGDGYASLNFFTNVKTVYFGSDVQTIKNSFNYKFYSFGTYSSSANWTSVPSISKFIFKPSSRLQSLENNAFGGIASAMTHLSSVQGLEKTSLKSIGSYAFANSERLTSITLPTSVTFLGEFAFYNCSALPSLPSLANTKLTTIEASTFRGCSSLSSVKTPSTLKTISSYAFDSCVYLSSVNLNSGLAVIGSSAFSGCKVLKSLSVPSSVTSIKSWAFNSCSALGKVVINSTKATIESGWSEFSGTLIRNSSSGHYIYVPYNSLSYYAKELYSDKLKLRPISIPSGVTMYRLYNKVSKEHLYTKDANEKKVLSNLKDWTYEGIGWYAPTSGTAVYRAYNPKSGEHVYTKDTNEINTLVKKFGWRNEGMAFRSDGTTGIVMYRLFNPAAGIGSHHYTSSTTEYNHLRSVGWKSEGTAWYALLNGSMQVSSSTYAMSSTSPTSISQAEDSVETQASTSTATQAIYRLYNPGLGEHLYTTDANEVKVLTARHGWKSEGTGWTAPTSGTSVYRLYNAGLGTHLYTIDTNEVSTLCKSWGWVKDFGGKPLFYSGGSVAITRLYNPGLAQHHYTADSNEIKTITQAKWGWKNEGTKLYCIETPAEKKFAIVYKNYDGSVLGQKSNVAYNQRAATANLPSNTVKVYYYDWNSSTYKYNTVTYTTPQRQDGSYVFTGWKENVSGNTLTMTAQYKKFTYTNGMPAETAKDLEDYFNKHITNTSIKEPDNVFTWTETYDGCDRYSLWFAYAPYGTQNCYWKVQRVIENDHCTFYISQYSW